MSEYQATLDYLFSSLPMYQNIGSRAYKANLNAIQSILKLLGNPEKKFKSIHVAGTNGKGSTSHLLAGALQANNYKVGLYTSPHLLDYRERIKLNGTLIPKEYVINFVNTNKPLFESIKPSFFEWSVALAFQYFAEEQVDIAVIEVGLGGRLDATNVITPEVSIITNIGLDHQQFLGTTRAEIAQEKAGIIKPNIPVVIGEKSPEILALIQDIAQSRKAMIHFPSDTFYETDLKSPYAQQNISTAMAALNVLSSIQLNEELTAQGINQVKVLTGLQGRWQEVSKAPRIVLDVGHNKEGLEYNMQKLFTEAKGQIYLMLGFVNDKTLSDIFTVLPKQAKYIVAQASNKRSIEQSQLMNEFTQAGLQVLPIYGSIDAQIRHLKNIISPLDSLYIGGSTFVVADALHFFQ